MRRCCQNHELGYALNPRGYFVVTALVNPAEPFNLVGPGAVPFSQGQVWVLDG